MEKSLNDYDKNLEELERQREKLEEVMKVMGQEWSESGAGIGWLGSLDLPDMNDSVTSPIGVIETLPPASITALTTNAIVPDISTTNTTMTIQPLLTNILSPITGPSPEYLQSLLHVNEVLLAQSLANTESSNNFCTVNDSFINTPMLTPITDHFTSPNSPPITPEDENSALTDDINTHDPESEKIISPLLISNKNLISTTATDQTTTTTAKII
ncbi:unnamed protein product [Mucor hiemalis]